MIQTLQVICHHPSTSLITDAIDGSQDMEPTANVRLAVLCFTISSRTVDNDRIKVFEISCADQHKWIELCRSAGSIEAIDRLPLMLMFHDKGTDEKFSLCFEKICETLVHVQAIN
jgi:hypothetical protein